MQKKNDKVGNKSEYKKEMKKGEKRVRKNIKIDLLKKVQILAYGHAWKIRELLNYIQLGGKYALIVAKLFFSHPHAN